MLGVVLSFGCAGGQQGGGSCQGYSCDEDGAKDLMWATVNGTYEPSDRAKQALEAVFGTAAGNMKKGGFTPDAFDLARANLQKFLHDVPEGPDDTLANEAEKIQKGTSNVCPLYPYC
jgi:hypothetical protein